MPEALQRIFNDFFDIIINAMFTYLDREVVIDGIAHVLASKYDTTLL